MTSYNLITPCAQCPFRSDIKPFIRPERADEILSTEGEFQCHKTIKVGEAIGPDGDDDWCEVIEDKTAQMCAGFLILLEKEQKPNQIMRIAERLGLYDRTKLRMDAPVYDNIDDCLAAHEQQFYKQKLERRKHG